MYYITMTIASIALIFTGYHLEESAPAIVWATLMVWGGATLGHVITEALNADQ